MAKPYCEVVGCVKEFEHFHCPEPGCGQAFEFYHHAADHGGASGIMGGMTYHPSILATLPPRCPWIATVFVKMETGPHAIYGGKSVDYQCDYGLGHRAHMTTRPNLGGHYNSRWPKNAKPRDPTAPAPAPEAPKPLPAILSRKTTKKCPDCDEAFTDDEPLDDEPKYECGSCGNEFLRSESENENSRCPECNKFAARAEGTFHEGCGGNLDEAEEVSVLVCSKCDETFDEEDDYQAALDHAKEHEEVA